MCEYSISKWVFQIVCSNCLFYIEHSSGVWSALNSMEYSLDGEEIAYKAPVVLGMYFQVVWCNKVHDRVALRLMWSIIQFWYYGLRSLAWSYYRFIKSRLAICKMILIKYLSVWFSNISFKSFFFALCAACAINKWFYEELRPLEDPLWLSIIYNYWVVYFPFIFI